MNFSITDSVVYIGVDDKTLDLFESQYIVPDGMAYNSYLIKDEKLAVMDSVDSRKTYEWLDNLDKALEGKTPDYIVVQHVEPDHSGSLKEVCEKYDLDDYTRNRIKIIELSMDSLFNNDKVKKCKLNDFF